MCGIAGIVDFAAARDPQANLRLARAMGDALTHRGPDAGGAWADAEGGVFLAHRRLAIVELSEAGAQPMATPDGQGHLSYNGEAYNAQDLRPGLEAAGYRFRGHSDTEVVLYGCQHWGPAETAKRLIGLFAFAYWDKRTRRLTLVRDRLGKKPLYWFRTAKALAFSSELRPLMLHPECPRTIDRASVAEYLRLLSVPAPHSIFEGVGKLEAGAVLTIDVPARRVAESRYWTLRGAAEAAAADPFAGSPEEAVEETERLLLDATRIRLVSDVPLGAFLSGGIDSSTIVALMQEVGGGNTRTFSIGYRSGDYDEAADAERVAAHLGTDHTSFVLEPADALAVIPKLPQIFDEPFADTSQIPTYLVSSLARSQVTVALTGDGGDEVFAGYNRHVAAGGLLRRLGRLPGPARAALSAAMTSLSPDAWSRLLRAVPAGVRPRAAGEKLHKLAPLLRLDEREQYRRLVSHWEEPEELVEGASERPSPIDDPSLDALLPDPVARMRYLDLATFLADDILTKVDRASMAVALETRAPLLDHRLVEWSFRVPTAIHLHGGEGKWLLRRILERRVPRALFERPKMGFGIPVGEWLRGPLRPWAENLLNPARLAATGLVRPEPIRSLWQSHRDGKVNAQYRLWPVLMLVAWLEAYGERGALAPAPMMAA
ncbi:MAG TPA: asparagine synthase (glutamine-hydrolyzing) [Allosphingosinicella sp.]|nr:asparagine synthase (glutamine-hydrolyzing) [Allosphingosinicella sp.]